MGAGTLAGRAAGGTPMSLAARPIIPIKGAGTPPLVRLKSLGQQIFGGLMQLTAHIKEATDGCLTVGVIEFPVLTVQAESIHEIPAAVSESAAALTGRPANDFVVSVRL